MRPCKACPAPLTQRLHNASDIRPRVSRVSQRSNKKNFSGHISTTIKTDFKLQCRTTDVLLRGSFKVPVVQLRALFLHSTWQRCVLRYALWETSSILTLQTMIPSASRNPADHWNELPLPADCGWRSEQSQTSGKDHYWQRNKICLFDLLDGEYHSSRSLFFLSDHFSIIIISLNSVYCLLMYLFNVNVQLCSLSTFWKTK